MVGWCVGGGGVWSVGKMKALEDFRATGKVVLARPGEIVRALGALWGDRKNVECGRNLLEWIEKWWDRGEKE